MSHVEVRVDGTPSTPALVLRPWGTADLEPLIEVYRDPVLRHWTRLPVESLEDAVRWLDIQQRGWAAGERLSFAVHADGDEGGGTLRLVGNVVIKRGNPRGGVGEVGYWTAAEARGQGVAPRSVEALTMWAFEELGLERLELLHQVDNPASCRVAEKSGYDFDRTLPATPPFPRDGHLHVRWRQVY